MSVTTYQFDPANKNKSTSIIKLNKNSDEWEDIEIIKDVAAHAQSKFERHAPYQTQT